MLLVYATRVEASITIHRRSFVRTAAPCGPVRQFRRDGGRRVVGPRV